jgi:Na+/phosphate symporter
MVVPPAAIGFVLLPAAFCFRIPAALLLLFAATSPAMCSGAMLLAAACAISGWAVALVHDCVRQPVAFQPAASLLDARELRFPERALQAVLQELRRLAEGLAQVTDAWLPLSLDQPPANRAAIEAVEQALNEFKPAAQRFLKHLARRRLDERQAQILLHLDRCVSDLERIGDHLHRLALHTLADAHSLSLPPGLHAASREAAVAANALLATVAASITGRHEIAEAAARRILDSRDQATQALGKAQEALQQAMESKTLPPNVALRCRNRFTHLERLARHVRAIALVEMQPEFWINPDAIHQRAGILHPVVPQAVSPRPYLERLQAEEADR